MTSLRLRKGEVMKKVTRAEARLTYKICMYAGEDEGNRNMRRHGRKAWNEEDWNAAANKFNELIKKCQTAP